MNAVRSFPDPTGRCPSAAHTLGLDALVTDATRNGSAILAEATQQMHDTDGNLKASILGGLATVDALLPGYTCGPCFRLHLAALAGAMADMLTPSAREDLLHQLRAKLLRMAEEGA